MNRTTNKIGHKKLTSTNVPYLRNNWDELAEKPHIYYRGECPNCDSWNASAGKENHPVYRTPMYCDKCNAFRGYLNVK